MFWGECDTFKFHWFHFSRRHVHVSVILEQGGEIYYFSPGAPKFVEPMPGFKGMSFERILQKLTLLKYRGATEAVLVQTEATRRKWGGFPWYNCQSMVRDLARLEMGFVMNPWHLAMKLRFFKQCKNYTVIRGVMLDGTSS